MRSNNLNNARTPVLKCEDSYQYSSIVLIIFILKYVLLWLKSTNLPLTLSNLFSHPMAQFGPILDKLQTVSAFKFQFVQTSKSFERRRSLSWNLLGVNSVQQAEGFYADWLKDLSTTYKLFVESLTMQASPQKRNFEAKLLHLAN